MNAAKRGSRRFRDPSSSVYEFTDDVLVRCPDCEKCAVVFAHLGEPERVTEHDGSISFRRRLRCPACGLFKDEYPASSVVGVSVDPYFRLPLWLRADCCGHVLWAYNIRHLDLLESYVGAYLRERGSDPDSMLAKLPAWLKAAKHRDEVLRTINRLRASVPLPGHYFDI